MTLKGSLVRRVGPLWEGPVLGFVSGRYLKRGRLEPYEEYMSIDLYTSPGCPDCAALKTWLEAQGIPFVEHDLSRPGVADEVKARLGVRVAPITVCDGHVLYGTAQEQLPRLKDLLHRD